MTKGQLYSLYFLLNDSQSALRGFCANLPATSSDGAFTAFKNQLVNSYIVGVTTLFVDADVENYRVKMRGLFVPIDAQSYMFSATETQIFNALGLSYNGGNCPPRDGEVKIISALLGVDPDTPLTQIKVGELWLSVTNKGTESDVSGLLTTHPATIDSRRNR